MESFCRIYLNAVAYHRTQLSLINHLMILQHLSCQHLMHCDTNRINITANSGLTISIMLRRSIFFRSQQYCILTFLFFITTYSVEIYQFNTSVTSHHNIAWFYISVNQWWILIMKHFKTSADFLYYEDYFFF